MTPYFLQNHIFDQIKKMILFVASRQTLIPIVSFDLSNEELKKFL